MLPPTLDLKEFQDLFPGIVGPDDLEAHRRAYRTWAAIGFRPIYRELYLFYRRRVAVERAAGLDPAAPNGEDGTPHVWRPVLWPWVGIAVLTVLALAALFAC